MNKRQYIFKILLGMVKGFIKDECSYKAGSLTFYTLLSIVPILAIVLGVAKGLGLEIYLQTEISNRLSEQPLLAKQFIVFAYSVLDQVHGGWIAFIGLISLLWTSLQLFDGIDYYLNVIWGVKTQQSYLRRYSRYFLMLIVGVFFFVLSSSFVIITIIQLNLATHKYSTINLLGPYLRLLVESFPIFINWLLFSFIYYFFISTKVHWKSVFIAGIIAGTTYQIVEWIYIHFQIGVAGYNAVYGSFAAIPLFLVWINLSWTIVLAGAELAYQIEKIKVD